MQATPTAPSGPRDHAPAMLPFLVLTALIALFEGYDLSVYGATVPSLLAAPDWHLSKGEAGDIGSLAALGMLIGAGVAGATGRRVGPRRLLLSGLSFFSLCMLASGAAGGPGTFAASRLLAGIGLGVVLPTLTAVVAEMSPAGQRARNIGIVMAASSLGSLGAPLLGAWLLPDVSFRVLYFVGAAALITVVPWALARLPESPLHLLRTGRGDQAARVTARFGLPEAQLPAQAPRDRLLGLGLLLTRRLAATTVLFWLMAFCGLLLTFGFSTWLPTIMQTGGFSTGTALTLTCLSWVGASVGLVPGGLLADRLGPRRVVAGAFLAGGAGLLVISRGPAMWLLYLCLLVCGLGLLGVQALVNAYLIDRMPADLRTPAMGWALSVGRLGAIVGPSLGGRLLDSGLGLEWNFYVFAAVGALGALAALCVPHRHTAHPQPLSHTAPALTLRPDSAA
ncbi:MFS transporter [Streptomyces sp. NPDC003247]|uniref:MFS transporter n=1 Tax=Streptomyces sp. NPDC003247 TaxID=3364677 RepID=UPI00367401C6